MLCLACGTSITAVLTMRDGETKQITKKVSCHVCGFTGTWNPEAVTAAIAEGKAPGLEPTEAPRRAAHQIGQ